MIEYQHCQVVTTTDSRDAADALARSAVTARLAACAQVVGPIVSTYRWEGEITTADEWQVVLKTTGDRQGELQEHLRAHHSYDVPEILVTAVAGGNPAYLEWITAETRPA